MHNYVNFFLKEYRPSLIEETQCPYSLDLPYSKEEAKTNNGLVIFMGEGLCVDLTHCVCINLISKHEV